MTHQIKETSRQGVTRTSGWTCCFGSCSFLRWWRWWRRDMKMTLEKLESWVCSLEVVAEDFEIVVLLSCSVHHWFFHKMTSSCDRRRCWMDRCLKNSTQDPKRTWRGNVTETLVTRDDVVGNRVKLNDAFRSLKKKTTKTKMMMEIVSNFRACLILLWLSFTWSLMSSLSLLHFQAKQDLRPCYTSTGGETTLSSKIEDYEEQEDGSARREENRKEAKYRIKLMFSSRFGRRTASQEEGKTKSDIKDTTRPQRWPKQKGSHEGLLL